MLPYAERRDVFMKETKVVLKYSSYGTNKKQLYYISIILFITTFVEKIKIITKR